MLSKHIKGLVNRYMKKTGLKGCVYDFSVDYDAILVSDILDIQKYLMKNNEIIVNVRV